MVNFVSSVTLPFLVLAGMLMIREAIAAPSTSEMQKDYELHLSFILGETAGEVQGTANITIEADRGLTLTFPEIEVTGVLLRDEGGTEVNLTPITDTLTLTPVPRARTLSISYTKTVEQDTHNLISSQGISLINNWHPIPDQPMRFSVTANLPDIFTAITESDSFPLDRQEQTIHSAFNHLVDTIHFIAGPYTIHKRQVRENLFISALFFKEDNALAEGYLEAGAAYLTRYEQEIGPYPYHHHVIVANRLPTGFSMPTFTLLGQAVLRLPFIKDTSLGHEIVHSWFGNGVRVAPGGGNWGEGLTAFLSDHAYRQAKGEGVVDRNESISKYLSYVKKDSTLSLSAFISASHNQPMAEARRAGGYIRGALLFHELREKIGELAFNEGIRQFYTKHRHGFASWEDLQHSLSLAAATDLHEFFTERLSRTDIPNLAIENISINQQKTQHILSFTIRQDTIKPYSLVVPIVVRTMAGDITLSREIKELKTTIAIPLEQRPLELTIDPDYAFLRQLGEEEFPAIWSRFLGATKRLAILDQASDLERYRPLLALFDDMDLPIKTAAQVTNKELAENTLLFLGTDQTPARALFGPPRVVQSDFSLDVRHNPLNQEHIAVLINSTGTAATSVAATRLLHYGKYSYLEFTNGRNTEKRKHQPRSGLHFVLEELPQGGAATAFTDFRGIVNDLAKNKVVYIGETHLSVADHRLQLRLIEALYQVHPKLAIGMEMFPTTSQPALDAYTLGTKETDERTFLKASDYYNVWRYDYRFFRDIINFARTKHLQIIALNLNHDIVANVFRAGGTDNLEKEVLSTLPRDRKLDMAGYTESLAQMHTVHQEGGHGSGALAGFIQAQALWDETMATTIAEFLQSHPDHLLVILAGTQHTRKDFGIPPRVARRVKVKQASVLNLAQGHPPTDIANVADFFFISAAEDLPEAPKIGVILGTDTKSGQAQLRIADFSPHGKAAAAGLLIGDIIRKINGFPTTTLADLHIALLDAKKGDTVDVLVTRSDNSEEKELGFRVELTALPATKPHP